MYDRFAAKLRQLMEAAEVNGAELGRRLDGTDKSLVSRWRSGRDRPEPATVVKIADVFGVDRMAMLQLAGWLPGDPADIDPRRASLMRFVRDEVPEEALGVVARLLQTFRVSPVRAKAHHSARANGRTDRLSTHSNQDDETPDKPTTCGWPYLQPAIAY